MTTKVKTNGCGVLEKKIDKLDKKLDKNTDRLAKRMSGLDKRMDGLDKKMQQFVTKSEFNDRLREMEDRLGQKIDEKYSLIFNLLDPIARQINEDREARVILTDRVEALEKTVFTA